MQMMHKKYVGLNVKRNGDDLLRIRADASFTEMYRKNPLPKAFAKSLVLAGSTISVNTEPSLL